MNRRAVLGLTRLEDRNLMSVATHLAFLQEPTDGIVGKPMAPSIRVVALDQFNQLVPSFNEPVSLAFSSNPGNAQLIGPSTAIAVGGVATFATTSVNAIGTDYTLVASSTGLPLPAMGLSFQDGQGRGEIPVQSFAWGETLESAVGGGGAGKAILQDFEVTIDTTTTDPAFLSSTASGKVIPKAVMHIRKAGGQQYLEYTLENVLISSYQTSSSDASPTATLKLNFEKIEESYRPTNADGSLGTPAVSSWNKKTQTGVGAGALIAPAPSTPPTIGVTFDGGEFVVKDYAWGATFELATGGGGGPGRSLVQEVEVELEPGAADPIFLVNAASSKSIPNVVLRVRAPGGQEYLKYELENVLISSYQRSTGGAVPTARLKLSFDKIKESYSPIKPDGSLGTAVVSSWNTRTNTGTGLDSIVAPALGSVPVLGATFDGGEFVVRSYSWGETITPPAGGGGASKASLQDFELELEPGTADPIFMANATGGRVIPKAVLHIRKAGGGTLEYLTYELENVLITSYQTGTGGATPTARLKLHFDKIIETYRPINPDGSLGTAVVGGWNVKSNSGVGADPLIAPALSGTPALGATFDGGEFIVRSYSFGQTFEPPAAGGGGASKPVFQDLELELEPGTADPAFLATLASGKQISKVLLHVRAPGGQEYLKIKLEDVLISSYQTSSSGATPTARLKLIFDTIEESYSPINPDGSLGTAVVGSWNLKTNTGTGIDPIVAPALASVPVMGATFDGGEFVMRSYNWGEKLTQPVGGPGDGKVLLEDFELELEPGTADPIFQANTSGGRVIPKVILHIRKAGTGGLEYLTYELEDVLITSYQMGTGGSTPTVRLKLHFGEIKILFRPTNQDGSLGPAIVASWNVKTGKDTGAEPLIAPTLASVPTLGAIFDGGEFKVRSYGFGETINPAAGGGSSKPVFQDLELELEPGTADPAFLATAASGKQIAEVLLNVRAPGGQEFLKVKLENVLISSYQISSSGGTTNLKLAFDKIELSLSPINSDGGLGTAIVGSWNLKTAVGSDTPIEDPAPPTTFIVSIPFDIRFTQNQRYVAAVYRDILGRPVDSVGLEYWSMQLDQGAPRAALVHLIDHSAEYFATIVGPAYQRFLGRVPDQEGLDYWVGRMVAGLTDEQLEAGFIGAPEYYQRAGGTDLAWIDAVYLDLLGRPADTDGETFWVNRLAQGADRSSVAFGFAASLEREAQHVDGLYRKYLDRVASTGEINFWVGQFAKGFTNEDLVTGFVSSDEYFNRQTAE